MPGIGDEHNIAPPERHPSSPLHTSFAIRGIYPPIFSSFKPRNYRICSPPGISHVAWSCDGNKLAAVGIDNVPRVWNPDETMEMRHADRFSGGNSIVDYVSWNPTHPELFCTSSKSDRQVLFWDTRQRKFAHRVPLKVFPIKISYAPDGQSLLYISAAQQLFFLALGKTGVEAKEEWHMCNRKVHLASEAIFNHMGDGIVITHNYEHTLQIVNLPSMVVQESLVAHIAGCVALALDPRGRYLASGGHDSIVNLFDVNDWIVARTITGSDEAIAALSFSFDGEYLASANAGTSIDIFATETGAPLHRVPTLASSPTVTWHPSKYVVAYCGQTKQCKGAPPPVAMISMFGLLDS